MPLCGRKLNTSVLNGFLRRRRLTMGHWVVRRPAALNALKHFVLRPIHTWTGANEALYVMSKISITSACTSLHFLKSANLPKGFLLSLTTVATCYTTRLYDTARHAYAALHSTFKLTFLTTCENSLKSSAWTALPSLCCSHATLSRFL